MRGYKGGGQAQMTHRSLGGQPGGAGPNKGGSGSIQGGGFGQQPAGGSRPWSPDAYQQPYHRDWSQNQQYQDMMAARDAWRQGPEYQAMQTAQQNYNRAMQESPQYQAMQDTRQAFGDWRSGQLGQSPLSSRQNLQQSIGGMPDLMPNAWVTGFGANGGIASLRGIRGRRP